MAQRFFLSNQDLKGIKLINLSLENLSSDPENPEIGTIYYNTVSNTIKLWDGTNWSSIGESSEGNVIIGTQEERIAFSTPYPGLQWNEIDTTTEQVTQYIYENGHWLPLKEVSETFIASFDSSDGQIDFTNLDITIQIPGESDMTINIGVDAECEITLPLGTTYTIIFPLVAGYMRLQNVTYLAGRPERHIYRTYRALSSNVRSVVLERSNPENWETSGPVEVIDNLLNTYGSYVIDEEHKKYAQLNPMDHSKFVDGTIWSGTYGNAFRRLPKVYYKIETNEVEEPLLRISHVDLNGHYWDEDWIGIYKGNVTDNKLRSIPNVTTTQSMTMTAFWNVAQLLGSNYGLVNYFDHCKLNALHLAKFGIANSERTMGSGLQNAGSGYYTHITGTTASLGDTTGQARYLSTNYYMNKLFGIEDLAGSTWEFRPNIRFDSSGARAVIYEGNVVSNTDPGIRTFLKLSSASGAYITKMVLGEYCDFIPNAVGGSSSTYYCDGAWASSSGSLLLVGGRSDAGPLCGLLTAASDTAFSDSAARIGARLAFYGDISEYDAVSGATLAALNA